MPTPKIDAWTTNTFPLATYIDDHDPGVDTALIIADKTKSITITRGASTLSAQTVRIEEDRGDRQIANQDGVQSAVDAIVFGYFGHPTIAATDIQKGDTFMADGRKFEVLAVVIELVDGLQAYCKVRT